jgi:hypothetical protein
MTDHNLVSNNSHHTNNNRDLECGQRNVLGSDGLGPQLHKHFQAPSSSSSINQPLLYKESSSRSLLSGMGFADDYVDDVVDEDGNEMLGLDADDGKIPAERLFAVLNVKSRSKFISSVAKLRRWTMCASSMSNSNPALSLFLWILTYLITLLPVIMYKVRHHFAGVTEWLLFLALIALQVFAAVLCLFYLKYVSRGDVSRVIFRQTTAARMVEVNVTRSFSLNDWIRNISRTDVNICWWIAVNLTLALVDLLNTKDFEETLCYLLWNFSSTLPIAVAVSMITGMLTAYKLQIETFYADRVRVPFPVGDMKAVGHEYTRMHKHLFLQSNINSLYLCAFMTVASVITFIEVVRIYMKQTVIASVIGKGLFYWVALFQIFVYIARLNHYGKFVSHQFLIQVMQVRAFVLGFYSQILCSGFFKYFTGLYRHAVGLGMHLIGGGPCSSPVCYDEFVCWG